MNSKNTNSRIKRFCHKVFGIRPEEITLVQLFFLYYTSIGMYWVIGASVGDTLFLSHLAKQGLSIPQIVPWVYVGIAIATVLSTALFDQIQKKIPRRWLMIITPTVFGLSLFLFRVLLNTGAGWLRFALAIWLEVGALISVTLFFSYAGDYFSSHQAKRLYGYICAGLSVGGIIGGYTVDILVSILGTANLLFVAAGLLFLSAVICKIISVLGKPRQDIEEDSGESLTLAAIFSKPYIRLIAAISFLGLILFVFVDFQMKWMVSNLPEEELAKFFGLFYSFIGVAEVFLQFLLVRFLLKRFGILNVLLMMPGFIGLGSLVFLALPRMMVSVGINFFRAVVGDTLDNPSKELLLLPVPSPVRQRAQVFLTGGLAPLGQGVGGLLLVFMSFFGLKVTAISVGSLLVAAAMLFPLMRLRKIYRQILGEALLNQYLEATDLESLLVTPSARRILSELLDSSDQDTVVFTLGLLKGRKLGNLIPRIQKLALAEDHQTVLPALSLLAGQPDNQTLAVIRKALSARDSVIRAGAIKALGQTLGENAVDELSNLLSETDPEIRNAAIVALARNGGTKGRELAVPILKETIYRGRSKDMQEVSLQVAQIGDPRLAPLVIPLLDHKDSSVRLAAVDCLGALGDSLAADALLAKLRTQDIRIAILDVLGRLSSTAVPVLASVLNDPGRPLVDRCALVHPVAKIGGPDAVNALWSLADPKQPLILAVDAGHALVNLKQNGVLGTITLDGLEQRLDLLYEKMELLQNTVQEMRNSDPFAALLYRDHARLCIELILSLLALVYDPARFEQVRLNLFSDVHSLRQGALELFNELLPRQQAARVEPLLAFWVDEQPVADISRASRPRRQKIDPRLIDLTCCYLDIDGRELSGDKAVERLDMIRQLKSVPLFSCLEGDYLTLVADIVEELHTDKGKVIFRHGEPGDSLYVILEGKLAVQVEDCEVARLQAGECVGELALLDGSPRSATVVVQEDSLLYRIPVDRFKELLQSQPVIARALLRVLDRRIRETQTAGELSSGDVPTTQEARDQTSAIKPSGLDTLIKTATFIKGVHLFNSLPDRYITSLARIARVVPVFANSALFHEGEPGNTLYLVCSGLLSVTIGGKEVTRLHRGDYVGEMALLNDLPRSASAIVVEDGQLLSISARDFNNLLATEPAIRLALLAGLASCLRRVTKTDTGASSEEGILPA